MTPKITMQTSITTVGTTVDGKNFDTESFPVVLTLDADDNAVSEWQGKKYSLEELSKITQHMEYLEKS